MEPTGDLSARVLVEQILSTEPPMTPVTRSVSRQQNPSSIYRTRLSVKKADAQTPQNILRRSLKHKMRESISKTNLPPASKGRTVSLGLGNPNTRASSSMLLEGDTPRHILMNILQTEPIKSPVIHEGAAPVESQSSSADHSIATNSSIELSGLDLPDLTFGNARSVAKRLSRKRPRRTVNVSTFIKKLRKGEGENEEDSAQEDLSLSSSSTTSFSLKTPFENVQTDKKGLRRRVSQRRKTTKEGFGDAVNRMLLDHETSSLIQGEQGLCESTLAQDFSPKLSNLKKQELINEIIHSNTARYDTGDVPVGDFAVLETQDQSTVMASAIRSVMSIGAQTQPDGKGEVMQVSECQEEKNTTDCEAELETPESEEEDDKGEREEKAAVNPQTEEVVVTPSVEEDNMEEKSLVYSQTKADAATPTEDENATTTPEDEYHIEDDKVALVDSQTEEDATTPPEDEDNMEEEEMVMVDSQTKDDSTTPSEGEDATSPPEEEDNMEEEEMALVDSQTEEDATTPEDEDATTPPEDEDNMEEEEMAVVNSQTEEDSTTPSEGEDATTPPEEQDNMEEEEMAVVDSQTEEDSTTPSEGEDATTPPEEQDNMEEEGMAVVDSQTEEDAATPSNEDATTPSEGEDNMEEEEGTKLPTEDSAAVPSEEENALAARSQSKGKTDEEQELNQYIEHIDRQAHRFGGTFIIPVGEDDTTEPGLSEQDVAGKNSLRDSHSSIKVDSSDLESSGPHAPHPDSDPDESGIEAQPSFHLLEVSSGKRAGDSPIEAPPVEGAVPHEQDEWEEYDDEEENKEIPMKTPAFVREKRTFQMAYQVSPTAFNPQTSNKSEAVPSVKPKRVRKPKSATVKNEVGLPKNYLMGVFRHFAKTKVSPDVYPVLKETMDKFFDRMAEDLETFALHAKRKTIEVEDVVLLLRRQGHVNDKVPVEVLIEKYLRMDQRRLLIPVATSGNIVIPKMKR
ncbi:centromere protein T isoform X2 [Nerophis ophidion]|uniref:centromere protein T isoform X2 n=1 Tax=Nerophis ophidion TaxID=159077 RepID=UPI002ADFC76D|nr:centromere protein T isoform X2 [Nerophis ophidion]